jgi:hypothetical protein
MDEDELGRDPVCRCGVRVSTCVRGCTLFACCGGYVAEGHMSDCTSLGTAEVHGAFRRPRYTGD